MVIMDLKIHKVGLLLKILNVSYFLNTTLKVIYHRSIIILSYHDFSFLPNVFPLKVDLVTL